MKEKTKEKTMLEKSIIDEFSSDATIELYRKKADDGLWGCESRLIEKYFKKGCRLLDIGCGTGRTTLQFKKLGYDVLGVDITPAMVSEAKKIAEEKGMKIEYQVGDATSLGFKDASFDAAFFSNHGWCQIPCGKQRYRSLEEVYRVLRPKGVYIFCIHPLKFFSYRLFGFRQLAKHYLLKPLGFEFPEQEFGDMFFKREGTEKQKQYIHIPFKRKVAALVKQAGFTLEENVTARALIGNAAGERDTMYFVCRK